MDFRSASRSIKAITFGGAAARLSELVSELRENKPEDLEISVELAPPRIAQLLPTPTGLTAVVAVDAKLGASAK